jgi:hypothetical protein
LVHRATNDEWFSAPLTTQRALMNGSSALFVLIALGLLSLACDHTPSTAPSGSVSVRSFSLTLHLANGCPALFSRINSPREFTFHGSLRVAGRTPATFMLPPKDVARPNTGDLAVDIVRSDTYRLSGSIHSSFSLDQVGYIVSVGSAKDPNEPATFVGSESVDGRMTGQFDGVVRVVHNVFSISDSCTASDFSLELVPE